MQTRWWLRFSAVAISVVFASSVPESQTTPGTRELPRALIVAGKRVGSLRLGDSHEKAQSLFPPKKDVDQEWDDSDGCGTVINWVDFEGRGNVFLHIKDNVVFQIDSATRRFETGSGITRGATPEQVREHYKGLRAFKLSNGKDEAQGERPLVYWMDENKGIAFAFSYYPRTRSWPLNHVIVFKPSANVCPNPEALPVRQARVASVFA